MADGYKSLLLSALVSVACSLVVSATAYYFLLPSVREAQLRTASLFSDGTYGSDNINGVVTDYYSVSVENHGPLVLNNAVVTLRISSGSYRRRDVEIDPPRKHTEEETKDGLIVSLGSLAPSDGVSVKLTLVENPTARSLSMINGRGPFFTHLTEWVSADGSPTIPVSWRYGGSSVSGSFTIRVEPAPKKRPAKSNGR
jgi:hypothetical protein